MTRSPQQQYFAVNEVTGQWRKAVSTWYHGELVYWRTEGTRAHSVAPITNASFKPPIKDFKNARVWVEQITFDKADQ